MKKGSSNDTAEKEDGQSGSKEKEAKKRRIAVLKNIEH